MFRRIFLVVLLFSWLLANLLWGDEWTFTPLGNLGGDLGLGKTSRAMAVSADGVAVVGESPATAGLGITPGDEAFLWMRPGPMQNLGVLSKEAFFSSATAVSLEGRVVVGKSRTPEGDRAFRWTRQQGMASLGTLPGHTQSTAHGVSGDGTIVVGESSLDLEMAFRWSADSGMIALGDLPGGEKRSVALAISHDGTTIVGFGIGQRGREAFRWTGGAMQPLGDLTGGDYVSTALAVSVDGNVVVGESASAEGWEAFRWTRDGMTGLGDLSGGSFHSAAFGVSADGDRIVGLATSEDGSDAFLWTPQTDMQSLTRLLQQQGLAQGWRLLYARGISGDGSVIVGTGRDPEGRESAWMAAVVK
jgi:probable HAF family extracellular repeat protein